MICFLFLFLVSFSCFFLYKPSVLSPASNIINIIERERGKEVGFDKGALTVAQVNIIDNYFEREEREIAGKGMVNVCVCDLLIICGIYFIFGNLFTPTTGGYLTTVNGLFAASFAAVVSIFNGLFGGIIGYIFAPIFGALTTHINGFIGGSVALHIGTELTIFNGLSNGLSCTDSFFWVMINMMQMHPTQVKVKINREIHQQIS